VIRKTKTGLYQIDFRDQHGRRFRKSFERYKDAEKKLREIKDEVDDRTFIAPCEIPSFRKIGSEWLKAQLSGHDPGTVAGWHTHLATHLYPLIGDRRLDRIDIQTVERDVRDALLAKRLGPKTVNKILTTGSSVMGMAVRHRVAKTNPFAEANRAKLETDEDAPIDECAVYTPEETRKLTSAAEAGIARAFLILVPRTGARMSEALALRWSDLDLEAGTVIIRKAVSRRKLPAELAGDMAQERFRLKGTKRKASVRVIPLTPATVLELKKWKLACPTTPDGWVFPADDGEPARKKTALESWFYPAAARAELRKLNVKALRHSFASALINEGRPVTEVQYLMGHSTAVTTLNVYSHFFKARDNRKVADVLAATFDGFEEDTEKTGHFEDTKTLETGTGRG
jgi:integrase